MGTYLMTGLRMQCEISCENEQEIDAIKKAAADEDMKEMPEGIYNVTFEDKKLIYKIDDKVLETQLIPFLEEFYEIYYGLSYSNNDTDCQKAIDFLKNNPYEKWNHFFEEGEAYECFFEDTWQRIYGHGLKNKGGSVILLRLAFEGKVLAEQMGLHLDLFNYAIRKAFPYKISEALSTKIEG